MGSPPNRPVQYILLDGAGPYTVTVDFPDYEWVTYGPACNYSVSPSTLDFDDAGGSGTISVTTTPSCAWQASSSTSWISGLSPTGGAGNGNVTFNVAAYAAGTPGSVSARSGVITVAGRQITINQAAPPQIPPPPRWLDQDVAEKALLVIDGTRDTIVAWVRNGGDRLAFLAELGERITTGLAGTVTRIGGVINGFQQGLLNPEVAIGVRVFVQALRDPDPETRGLGMSPTRRQQLQDVLAEIKRQEGRIVQPRNNAGGRSNFNVPVTPNRPVTFDPPLAVGFEYEAPAGGPLFSSFALPLLVPDQGTYRIEVYEGRRWRKVFDAKPLKEYRFPRPTLRFRVLGIPPAARVQHGDREHRWLTMLTFNRKGQFRGSMRSIPSSGPGALRPSGS